MTTLLSRHGCQPVNRRPIGLTVLAGKVTILTLMNGYVLKTEWLQPWAERTESGGGRTHQRHSLLSLSDIANHFQKFKKKVGLCFLLFNISNPPSTVSFRSARLYVLRICCSLQSRPGSWLKNVINKAQVIDFPLSRSEFSFWHLKTEIGSIWKCL